MTSRAAIKVSPIRESATGTPKIEKRQIQAGESGFWHQLSKTRGEADNKERFFHHTLVSRRATVLFVESNLV
jgi:hypothetical protein